MKVQLKVIFITNLFLISTINSSLNFLSESNSEEITQLIQNISDIEPKTIHELQRVLKGMIKGFPLFKNATMDNDCVTNTTFSNEMIKIYTKINQANWKGDSLRDDLLNIVDDIVQNKEIFITEINECGKLHINMDKGLNEMSTFLSQKDYYDKFTMNLVGNMKKISEIKDQINALKEKGNFIGCGNKLGQLINLVFFWDI